ncbi:MAG: hypothetical protein V1769_00430 [Thermoplasmatota archaeon]
MILTLKKNPLSTNVYFEKQHGRLSKFEIGNPCLSAKDMVIFFKSDTNDSQKT